MNVNPDPVLYFYDCLLTTPKEVSEIWPSKWSLTKVAYLTNRYGAMAFWILGLVAYLLVTDSVKVRFLLFIFVLWFMVYVANRREINRGYWILDLTLFVAGAKYLAYLPLLSATLSTLQLPVSDTQLFSFLENPSDI